MKPTHSLAKPPSAAIEHAEPGVAGAGRTPSQAAIIDSYRIVTDARASGAELINEPRAVQQVLTDADTLLTSPADRTSGA
ncbi:hypothetical protein LWC34_13655 [Kibdelosporangium philippinense]|uniref:FXSXX-COOH protein n=2 Tax=Kibdelosporangium philippinense TaxID=211113 RepID=A0ABS8ZDH1_9PSEU|nr:hypothetical protein [Kibdelosporangium philippinense]MCE7003867.1 hypothetical protein [Kibdelosporangium philippinense]